MSDSLRPHESQHARPPCPSPTPRVHPDSRPSSQWCYPAISSSVVPFSSCPQSLPASECFPMSQLFTWGSQSTGVSALASFLPKKSQGWSSEWTGWISLQSKGLSRVFSNTTVQKHQFFSAQRLYLGFIFDKKFKRCLSVSWGFPRSSVSKESAVVQETWVQSLGLEVPLEMEMATHSSILAWKISWTEEPGGLQSMGSQRIGYDWVTNTYFLFHSVNILIHEK